MPMASATTINPITIPVFTEDPPELPVCPERCDAPEIPDLVDPAADPAAAVAPAVPAVAPAVPAAAPTAAAATLFSSASSISACAKSQYFD